MKTSLGLIQYLVDNNLVRHYAAWLKLKSLHSNGCIYNYNSNKLHNKSNLSNNSVRKYVSFFLSEKWCSIRHGNLCFAKESKVRRLCEVKIGKFIKLNNHSKIQDIVSEIRYILIKNKHDQFIYLREKTNDLRNPKGDDALAKHKKSLKFFKKSSSRPIEGESFGYKVSFLKIGQHLNLSKSSAYYLIKKKQEEGKVKKTTSTNKLYKLESKQMEKYLPNAHYVYNGFVYKVGCNKYEML